MNFQSESGFYFFNALRRPSSYYSFLFCNNHTKYKESPSYYGFLFCNNYTKYKESSSYYSLQYCYQSIVSKAIHSPP